MTVLLLKDNIKYSTNKNFVFNDTIVSKNEKEKQVDENFTISSL